MASAYFPGDEEEIPSQDVKDLLEHATSTKTQIVIGCDANAHHEVWGSTDTNMRGEYLFNYLNNVGLDIANVGSKPTFVTKNRKEVLDLTLTSRLVASKISGWRVTDETSMSDHRHIRFNIGIGVKRTLTYRDPRKTDWNKYQGLLKERLVDQIQKMDTPSKLNLEADKLNAAILTSFKDSCSPRMVTTNRDLPWWNRELRYLRRETRRLFNRAKVTGCWDDYKSSLTRYNKALRNAKRTSWRSFCEKVEGLSKAARLQKLFSKIATNPIGTLRNSSGSLTDSPEGMLECLIRTHFPGAETSRLRNNVRRLGRGVAQQSLALAREIFTKERVTWAVESFQPYKSPGGDGILPIQIKQGISVFLPLAMNIFRYSMALGQIPDAWCGVKVIFIPKSGKRAPEDPKSYRPISLTSFFLKTMEKAVGQFIRERYLPLHPLQVTQHAYQKGKSTESALDTLVYKVHNSIQNKETALCCFMDIEGAFDNTSYDSISEAAAKFGIASEITSWIRTMLEDRLISVEMGEHRLLVSPQRGCPQGGVLSPLLWLMVMDELLETLASEGLDALAYADDLVIIARGKFGHTLSNLVQYAIGVVDSWCRKTGLSISPNKTKIIPFTRRRNIDCTPLVVKGQLIDFSKEHRYLGVTLDQKLLWKSHIDQICNKARTALAAGRRLVGKSWGMTPRMTFWLYTAVVRPMVTYAAVVWWPKVKEKTTRARLQSLQRTACLGITGAMGTCPTAALEALLGLPPLDIFVMQEAAMAAVRLRWVSGSPGHRGILDAVGVGGEGKPVDSMTAEFCFRKHFHVHIASREEWDNDPRKEWGVSCWYTDGSVMSGRAGFGVSGPRVALSQSLGEGPSIYQAELLAIDACVKNALARDLKGGNIHIFSDSQAVLKALEGYKFTSKLTWECHESLNKLGRENKVILTWVPGHSGIEGNERADCLARQGASQPFHGPQPFCGIPASAYKREAKLWAENEALTRWRDQHGLRHSKKFIFLEKYRNNTLTSLSRSEIKVFVELMTGHCPLRLHMKRIGLGEEDICRWCLEHEETAEHVLCDCEALAGLRRAHLGGPILDPKDVADLSPSQILKFYREVP